jgi:hypothetical protein
VIISFHPGNTMRVVDALIKANKRFDLRPGFDYRDGVKGRGSC